MLKLVTEEQIGIVLGLEMSRLARNSEDWSDLFEVSAIFRTLIADEDGLFEPNEPNDRLVLGLKGIISEMELHTMKIRRNEVISTRLSVANSFTTCRWDM